jgi:parvulin-like peptidyl-prolyl isomerase
VGGPQQLEAALRANGLTMQEFRTAIQQQIRRDRLIQAFIQKERIARRAPPVTEAELRTYLAENAARLGERPSTITFEQVVLPVTPSDTALARARTLADSVYVLALAGEDFAELARRFSQDPGTREQGGDLGYFRENTMVTEFSRATFAMRPGMISPPVRTSFGYHIIKLERVRGAERQARHVLIRPEPSAEDAERAQQLAQEIAAQLRAGADIDSLVARHGDKDEQRRVGPVVRDQLPEPYLSALTSAATNDIIGPLAIGEAGAQKWAVVRVEAVQSSGPYSLDDPFVRQRIRRLVEDQKLLAEIVGELRRRTHIDVRQG